VTLGLTIASSLGFTIDLEILLALVFFFNTKNELFNLEIKNVNNK
jgi:hypothetical protein